MTTNPAHTPDPTAPDKPAELDPATHREAWPCQAGLMAGALTTDDARPASVVPDTPGLRLMQRGLDEMREQMVPDSPDVRERVRGVLIDAARRESFSGTDIDELTDAVLAAVDQGVTAEQAWAEGYRQAMVAFEAIPNHGDPADYGPPTDGPHTNPYRAAVRPTGQEQADG